MPGESAEFVTPNRCQVEQGSVEASSDAYAIGLPRRAAHHRTQVVAAVFISANPDTPEGRLAVGDEHRAIQDRLRKAEHRAALNLVAWPGARPDDLLQALNQHAPTILHFSGHGRPDGIVLLDDAGEPHVASHEALANVIGLFADSVRLVVLNTCFGDVSAHTIGEAIDCVIGMPPETDDAAARTFAAAFYSAVGFGKSIRNAFDQGCAAIALNNLPLSSRPRLVTRAGVDPAQVVLIRRTPHCLLNTSG